MIASEHYAQLLHTTMRRFCIVRTHRNTFQCLLCFRRWVLNEPETHDVGCLATPMENTNARSNR